MSMLALKGLLKGINGLSDFDSLHTIGESVPRLFHQIETNICNDHIYMASFQVDVYRQSGTAIYSVSARRIWHFIASDLALL